MDTMSVRQWTTYADWPLRDIQELGCVYAIGVPNGHSLQIGINAIAASTNAIYLWLALWPPASVIFTMRAVSGINDGDNPLQGVIN